MKLLITDAKGFIGKNLIAELKNRGYNEILEYYVETDPSLLSEYTKECDFVFHLAEVNRPKDEKEFFEDKSGFTSALLENLKENNNKAPVLITSSIQAENDSSYGKNKKAAEDLMFEYSKKTRAPVFVYRLPIVFGKWCSPNFNNAIATFCYNIVNNLDITINDPEILLKLVYIDDVVNEFIEALKGKSKKTGEYFYIPVVHERKLGEIASLIQAFKESRATLSIPDMSDSFVKKLYSTYLSYIPKENFSYPLKMNTDNRGSFTEFIRTTERGQLSVNVSKPGITKGNHWHNTKNEKFLVVSGRASIKFRQIHSNEIIEYTVSGDNPEVVDIPVGYTHNITNIGETELVTLMWANECYDDEKPDTYFLKM